MSALPNEIVLRPRFQLPLDLSKDEILSRLQAKNVDFVKTRVDDHVFIRFPKTEQHYWSPQLHVEVIEQDGKNVLYGLFGPSPTIWTMFMFAHFIVAVVFVIFGIWGYSNWSIDKPYALQISVMFFMVVLWFALYFIGRIGKRTGREQMHRLHEHMNTCLDI